MSGLTSIPKPATPGQIENATDPTSLKSAGNDALNKGDFVTASRMYSLGIDLLLGNKEPAEFSDSEFFAMDVKSGNVLHLLFCNRSFTNVKLHDYQLAKEGKIKK